VPHGPRQRTGLFVAQPIKRGVLAHGSTPHCREQYGSNAEASGQGGEEKRNLEGNGAEAGWKDYTRESCVARGISQKFTLFAGSFRCCQVS
jgi:hypothetical protein